MQAATETTAAGIRPEGSSAQAAYAAFLEQTLAETLDRIARKPALRAAVPRAYLLRAAVRGSEAFGVASGQVLRDLREAVDRRRRSLAWKLRALPGALDMLWRVLTFVLAWELYASFLGRRYVADASESRDAATLGLAPKPRAADPLASIVLLSYNRLAYLRTTVRSLYATTDASDFELIVVDNGSTDGSAELARDLAARELADKVILRSRNHGNCPGFNVGFAHADPRSGYVVKLDSDIVLLTPEWLRRFHRVFTAHADVGGLCMSQVNNTIIRWAPRTRIEGEEASAWDWAVCGGSCMTIPRRVFEQVGYFNEDFDFAYMPDDVDYALRLSFFGYRAFNMQGCRAYHRGDLDRKRYGRRVSDTIRIQRERWRPALWSARYVEGPRGARLDYPRYSGCVFPHDRRVLELD